MRLTGQKAIDYVEQLGGSLTPNKYNDPTEPARPCVSIEEAREIAKEDPSLIYFDVNTAHPDHAAIMEAIS